MEHINALKTLTEALEQAGTREDRTITFVGSSTTVSSCRDVYLESLRVKRGLRAKGFVKGDKVLLLCENDRNFIVLLWGCILTGVIPIPLTPLNPYNISGIESQRFRNVHDLMKAPLLTDYNVEFLESVLKTSPTFYEMSDILAAGDGPDDCPEMRPAEDDVALIQFSSGSTGNPKGVVLTHHNIMTNIKQIIGAISPLSNERALSWMPYYHDMGLVGFHLAPLVANIDQVKTSIIHFIKNPITWLKQVSDYQATIISATNFALELILKRLERDRSKNNRPQYDIDLSRVRILFLGAEPISVSTYQQFVEMMQPFKLSPKAIHPVYGMAEATLAVSFPPVDEEPRIVSLNNDQCASLQVQDTSPWMPGCDMKYLDLGYPLNGGEIQVRDEESGLLPEMTVGEIFIRGSNVMSGYYGIPREETFQGDFFATGDMGFMHQGRLCIVGRKKDVIFVYGKNYYASDIEDIIKSRCHDLFAHVSIVGIHDHREGREKVIMLFYPAPGKTLEDIREQLAELKQYVNRMIGFPINHLVLARRNSIPKTTSGKIMRYKIAEMFVRGEFDDCVVRV